MLVKYDLHIHSKLSSCASELSTPNNILNMCMLKELSLVSVSDHNSLKQHYAFSKIINSYDYLFLYGVEITVQEGFHILAYFENYEDAMLMDSIIDNSLDKSVLLNKDLFSQIVYDELDNESRYIDYVLNQKSRLNFNEISKFIRKFNGIIILAHIDRLNSGVLSYYTDLKGFDFDGIELDNSKNIINLIKKYPILKTYRYLINSDSHSIDTINENNFINLNELSFKGFKEWLKNE